MHERKAGRGSVRRGEVEKSLRPEYVTRIQPDVTSRAAETLRRRAVEAAIWGMPIVSVEAMRRGYFDLGAKYGDIVYLSRPADWRLQLTTPNASNLYVYFNFNLKAGPVMLHVPPAAGAGLFGSILDAWQVPLADVGPEGEDRGEGGKYALLPPEFTRAAPPNSIAVRCNTHNGYVALRAIPKTRSPADTDKALALVRQLCMYRLSDAANPPTHRHIDVSGKVFDGIVRMDDTFFDNLSRIVNEEPVQPRDLIMMGQLRSIGIERGKPFEPDDATRKILREAMLEARAQFMDANTAGLTPYWPDAQWGTPAYVATGARTAFSYVTEDYLDVDGRGAMFFSACAGAKKPGAATMYLFGARDSKGAVFDGSRTYRLRVPPNVPAKQFWAATAYDLETCAFIRESPSVEINSYQALRPNADGSVDAVFGPTAPDGDDTNWVHTAPGRTWFTVFRFYGPEQAIRDRSWKLPDIEPV